MRRLIIALTAILCYSLTCLAQEIIEHKVLRGETLSSIAEKYGVAKESIIKLNPEAADYIYNGMTLKIPIPVDTNQVLPLEQPLSPQQQSPIESPAPADTLDTRQADTINDRADGTLYAVVTPSTEYASEEAANKPRMALLHVGYSCMKIADDSENATLDGVTGGFAWAMSIGNSGLMIGADVSVSYHFMSDKAYCFDSKLSLTSLELSPLVAFRLSLADNLSFTPYTGLSYIAYISGSCTYGDLTFSPFDKDIYEPWSKSQLRWNIGANFAFKGLTFGLSYGAYLSTLYDGASQSTFSVSLGYNL